MDHAIDKVVVDQILAYLLLRTAAIQYPGLVYYCLKQAGLTIDRFTAAGYSKISDWEKITSMDDLQIGDILFFRYGGKSVGHTGIYIGNGEMIDASKSNGEVVQRSCKTSYWTRNFVVARRPF